MARAANKELTTEEKLAASLVPVEEQPYPVPGNWCWIHLLKSFDNQTDSKRKIPQKEYLEQGRFAIVDQGQDAIGGYTDDETMIFTGELPVIVFGDHTRCVKYVDFTFVQGADGVKVLLPHKFYLPKAFFYAMQSVDIPNMGYRRHYPLFKNYSIPLPPLPEQQRIVNLIESLFADLDVAKEKLQSVLEGFAQRKAAILHQAFTGKLTEKWREENGIKDDSWVESNLGSVLKEVKYGTSSKSSYENQGMAVLRIPNIGNGMIDYSDIKYLEYDDVPENDLVNIGDILMIRSNGSRDIVGKAAIVDSVNVPMTYASFLIRLRCDREKISSSYVIKLLESPDTREQFLNKAKSSAGIHNVNTQEIKSIKLKIPPLPEQKEIVRLLDELFAKEQQAQSAIESVLDHIDTMKKSILARAFRGELGTNDSTDESAMELLRRVL